MKCFLSFLLIFFLLPICGEAKDPSVLKDGVVKIRAGNKTGSGFILDIQDRYVFVLTAYHVVEGQKDIAVSFLREPHRALSARIVKNQFEQGDQGLSVLKIETADTRGLLPLYLSQEVKPKTTEPVFAIGFYGAGNVPWSITKGWIVGDLTGPIHFEGAIEEGNSGGPLLQNREIIGVVTQKTNAYNLAVPARLVEYFAESVIGLLPVRCNATLIPRKVCQTHYPIDRRSCDFIKRGNELYEEGQYPLAIETYDEAIGSKPGYAVLYNNRGVIKATLRDFANAQKDFQRALGLDPDYSVAEVNLNLVDYYNYFFEWADRREAPEQLKPNFLSTLIDRVGGRKNDDSQNEIFGELLLDVLSEAGQRYYEYLKFEDQVANFDQGDFACYGGDIIAANNELTSILTKELASYMRTDHLLKR